MGARCNRSAGDRDWVSTGTARLRDVCPAGSHSAEPVSRAALDRESQGDSREQPACRRDWRPGCHDCRSRKFEHAADSVGADRGFSAASCASMPTPKAQGRGQADKAAADRPARKEVVEISGHIRDARLLPDRPADAGKRRPVWSASSVSSRDETTIRARVSEGDPSAWVRLHVTTTDRRNQNDASIVRGSDAITVASRGIRLDASITSSAIVKPSVNSSRASASRIR